MTTTTIPIRVKIARTPLGWKLTLSQNMSIAMGPEFHPMLHFYVTGGNRTARVNGTDNETLDAFNIGAMWEAWS